MSVSDHGMISNEDPNIGQLYSSESMFEKFFKSSALSLKWWAKYFSETSYGSENFCIERIDPKLQVFLVYRRTVTTLYT